MTREKLEKAKDLLNEIDLCREHKELIGALLNKGDDWGDDWRLDFMVGTECVPLYKSVYGEDFISIYKKTLDKKIEELNKEFELL